MAKKSAPPFAPAPKGRMIQSAIDLDPAYQQAHPKNWRRLAENIVRQEMVKSYGCKAKEIVFEQVQREDGRVTIFAKAPGRD